MNLMDDAPDTRELDRQALLEQKLSLEAALDEAVDDGCAETYLASLRRQIAEVTAQLARN